MQNIIIIVCIKKVCGHNTITTYDHNVQIIMHKTKPKQFNTVHNKNHTNINRICTVRKQIIILYATNMHNIMITLKIHGESDISTR